MFTERPKTPVLVGGMILLLVQGALGADVAALSWMSGNWVGEMGSVRIEETWSAPDGGMMMGMFRLVKDGKPEFYEFMAIESADTGIGVVLKLRHFNPGLVAWEDRDAALAFRLTENANRKAVFQQDDAETKLIYERMADGTLKVTLVKAEAGKSSRSQFIFRLN